MSHPQNEYRLTSQYASYEAELLHGTLALAERHHINLEGTIAWAFTFPGQPIFSGLRAFTTNDIDLPVLNAFRMFGLMKGARLVAEGTGGLAVGDVLESSVKANPDVKAIATHDSHRVNALVWSYHDDSNQSAPAEIRLRIDGLPQGVSRVLLEHWGVDRDHSNSYTAWKTMGSPQNPSADEYERLKAAGQLQLRESPRWIVADGSFDLYQDAGDSYDYEKGAHAIIPLRWAESTRRLTLGERKGSYPEMPARMQFNIIWVSAGHGSGGDATQPDETVEYTGKEISIAAP